MIKDSINFEITYVLYKGGGGSEKAVETIPDWARPYLENVGNIANTAYQSGGLSQVAGTNAPLNAAFGSGARAIADQTNSALMSTNAQRDRIGGLAGSGGAVLGSGDFANLMGKADFNASNAAQIASGPGYNASNAAQIASGPGYNAFNASQIASSPGYNAFNASQIASGPGYNAFNASQIANSGGYDTRALKDSAILQADQAMAARGNRYGTQGTLGSARQRVEQGAEDAATRAKFAEIDYAAAQQNTQNRLAGEQLASGVYNQNTQNRLAGEQLTSGIYNQNTQNRLAGEQLASGVYNQNTQNRLAGEQLASGVYNQNTQNRLAAEQLGAGVSNQNFANTASGMTLAQKVGDSAFQNKLAAEQALNQTNQAGQGFATTAADALGKIGTGQRTIEQQNLDAGWQGLERYASTIYGNPARQAAGAAKGGK